MGVEYAHGIFVADLSWQPKLEHVGKVHAVLKAWKLAHPKLGYVDLAGAGAPAKPKVLPANTLVELGHITGKPVETALGVSQYGEAADTRYCDVSLILGVDFRVIRSEFYEVIVKTPPKNGKQAVAQAPYIRGLRSATTYPATWLTTPPKTKAAGAFAGVWRSGVILDCGKDLPEGCDDDGFAVAAKLRAELAKAFGTKLVEQGWIY